MHAPVAMIPVKERIPPVLCGVFDLVVVMLRRCDDVLLFGVVDPLCVST